MKILRTRKEFSAWRSQRKFNHKSIGFIPTMGALHAGHLSLVSHSRKQNDLTVVSIFVNPTQFGPKEDLKKYPRTEVADLDLLRKSKVDAVFLPRSVKEIYLLKDETKIQPRSSLTNILEGRFRPGHFEGVVTVVFKLFSIVRPARAYFGEKDYQQLQVIKAMVEDLFLPIQIIPVKTYREKSGLAMSSRNRYLDSKSFKSAADLYRVMKASRTLSEARKKLSLLGFKLQYLENWNDDLSASRAGNKGRWLVAAFYKNIRLIDNQKK